MDATIKQFEIGQTYSTRSSCDWDTIFSWTVIKRTAKFITVDDGYGEIKRVGVKVWNGVESAMPYGNYSMSPVIRAGKEW